MKGKNRRQFIGLTVLYVIGAALETLSISALLPLISEFVEPSAEKGTLLRKALIVFALFLGKNIYLYIVALLMNNSIPVE